MEELFIQKLFRVLVLPGKESVDKGSSKIHLTVVTRISPTIINTVNNYAKLKLKL